MLSLLLKSIRSRIIPTSLVTISLMASMVLLLSIERIQQGAEEGFNQSISGVDAIIGPRSSSIELVLYFTLADQLIISRLRQLMTSGREMISIG